MKISEILQIQPGMISLIGGGGKTTLLYKLARELSVTGTVIVCTSTKIMEPEDITVVTDSADSIACALKEHRIVCAGTRIAGGKLSAPAMGFAGLRELADYVLVEADGAHRLPIKAHAEYEPVIPAETGRTVLVIGADAFGQPIADICHRPALFAAVAGVDIRSAVTPEIAVRVINAEGYGDMIYINKVEDARAMAYARSLADFIDLPITAGSLFREEYVCLR